MKHRGTILTVASATPLPLSLKVPALGLPLFSGECAFALKNSSCAADTTAIMIISDEQVRRAAEYLRSCADAVSCVERAPELDRAVIARAVTAALSAPEVRPERIEQASYVVDGYLPDAESVAEKLLGRIISDSIR
jgi:hypothetical protein